MKFLSKLWLFIIILIGGIFIIVSLTFAQEGQPPSPPSASDIVAKMKQELNLSDEQASQVIPVIQEEIQEMQTIMEQARNQGVSREAMLSQMESLHKNTESKLSQYLTEDQLTQWKNRRQQPSRRGGNKDAPSEKNNQTEGE